MSLKLTDSWGNHFLFEILSRSAAFSLCNDSGPHLSDRLPSAITPHFFKDLSDCRFNSISDATPHSSTVNKIAVNWRGSFFKITQSSLRNYIYCILSSVFYLSDGFDEKLPGIMWQRFFCKSLPLFSEVQSDQFLNDAHFCECT